MADAKLDLSTQIDRPIVRIDGEEYEMFSPHEMTLVQIHNIQSQGRMLESLMSKDQLSDNERKKLTGIGDTLLSAIMVDIPEEVRSRLTDIMKLRLVTVFTRLSSTEAGD